MLQWLKKLSLFTLFALLIIFSSFSFAEEKKPINAPNALPGVEKEMLSPDYWIELNDDADTVIMTPEEIVEFNEKNRQRKVVFKDYYGKPDPLERAFEITETKGPVMNLINILELPERLDGKSLKDRLKKNIEWLYSRDYYDDRNALYDENMRQKIVDAMAVESIPEEIIRRFGIVVKRADVRHCPTSVPGFSETKWECDNFQATALYTGNPVAVIHQSSDGAFLYIESPISRGWVAADKIAFGRKEEVLELTNDKNFLMATADRVSVYGDPGLTVFSQYFYCSATLPLVAKNDTFYVVKLPFREPDGKLAVTEGYVKSDADVHIGYLSYTKRNMLVQFFKLLNLPYGWADQQNKRDCSGTQRVLLRCFGIKTGRHPSFVLSSSDHQVFINPDLSAEEKKAEIAKLEPVITLAGNSGHIVMYLGKAKNGQQYFMHQAGWGYDEGDQHYTVNRVSINSFDHKWYDVHAPNVFTTFRK